MFRIVIDHGSHRNYLHASSRWAANLICNKYIFNAKQSGDYKTQFYVEEGSYDQETHVWKSIE